MRDLGLRVITDSLQHLLQRSPAILVRVGGILSRQDHGGGRDWSKSGLPVRVNWFQLRALIVWNQEKSKVTVNRFGEIASLCLDDALEDPSILLYIPKGEKMERVRRTRSSENGRKVEIERIFQLKPDRMPLRKTLTGKFGKVSGTRVGVSNALETIFAVLQVRRDESRCRPPRGTA